MQLSELQELSQVSSPKNCLELVGDSGSGLCRWPYSLLNYPPPFMLTNSLSTKETRMYTREF